MDWIKKNWIVVLVVVLFLGAFVYWRSKEEQKKKELLKRFNNLKDYISGEVEKFKKARDAQDAEGMEEHAWGKKMLDKAKESGKDVEVHIHNEARWMMINDSKYDFDEDFVDKYIKKH